MSDVPRGTEAVRKQIFGDREPVAVAYAEALSTSGVERGLIGPREVSRIWERHILNCAVVAELIADGASVADVGSGAGLPGLVLAIARPDCTVTLVEPLLRRVVWLDEVIGELGVTNVEVVRDRAEAVSRMSRRFDVVTSRAVAPLPALAGMCLPLTNLHGSMLALKGSTAETELVAAEAELRRLGAQRWEVRLCGEALLEEPTTVIDVKAGISVTRPAPASRKVPRRGRSRS